MGLLDQLASFAHEANNKTYGAALRTGQIAAKGLANLPVRAVEAINPWDAESKGDALLNQTANRYGFTPQFKQQVYKSNPIISNDMNSGALEAGTTADGYDQQGQLHRTVINSSAPNNEQQDVLLHEGLHDAYATLKPQQVSLFNDLVNRASQQLPTHYGPVQPDGSKTATDIGLEDYLISRTMDYKAFPDRQGQMYDNINQLPKSLQNEVHSYVPEYFNSYHQQMPSYLADYYANYYNTGGKATGLQQNSPLQQLLGRIFN